MDIELYDDDGHKVKAQILFTHYDYNFKKKYVFYTIDNDLVASSYEIEGERLILNNDLTTKEYDMLDEILKRKLKEEM